MSQNVSSFDVTVKRAIQTTKKNSKRILNHMPSGYEMEWNCSSLPLYQREKKKRTQSKRSCTL